MSDDTEYYDLLGLKKEDNPTADQIKRAFKKQARRLHPDLNPDGDPQEFAKINAAYEVLKDADKRELYDQYGKEGVERGGAPGGGFGFPFGDIFGGMGGMGGGRRRGPVKGETVRQQIQVTLEDIYKGATRKIRVTRTRICKDCKGVGASDSSKVEDCPQCRGTGFVTSYQQLGPGFVTQTRSPCDSCKGEGKKIDRAHICKSCNGKKVISVKSTLDIHITPGMKEGSKFVFEGEADEKPGVQAGDIVFYLSQLPHKVFERDGIHLKMKKTITLAAALTGTEFAVNHLDKRTLLVKSKIGEVIRPGQEKMIQGEGMPLERRPFEKGNLFILFNIEFPSKIPPNIAEKLNQLLPPKKHVNSDSLKGKEVEQVELVEPEYTQQEQASDRNAYDEDDDEERGGVGCAAS